MARLAAILKTLAVIGWRPVQDANGELAPVDARAVWLIGSAGTSRRQFACSASGMIFGHHRSGGWHPTSAGMTRAPKLWRTLREAAWASLDSTGGSMNNPTPALALR